MPDPASPGAGSFYGAVRLSSKGQIVIPQRVREDFGLKAGDQLIVLGRPEQEGFALLKPEGFMRVQQELARLQAQLGLSGAGPAPVGATTEPVMTGPDLGKAPPVDPGA